MKNVEEHDSVRSLLAGSAVISSNALPQTWTRPVSWAVIMSAHAQTKSFDQDWDCKDSNGYGMVADDSNGYGD